jgi:RHH-type proline utilization regulon transcriptional repressor/proline dehydrogenase/delta 1-pyrroline-5-carboxylate dehydrogenase
LPGFTPNERITLPRHLYGAGRPNAAGLDLADENSLTALAAGVAESVRIRWTAQPAGGGNPPRPVLNPADNRDVVGAVREAGPADIEAALAAVASAASAWAATPAAQRAAVLRQAADAMEARMPVLIGLIVREAGKSLPSAVAEVREAVDFLRYYAEEVSNLDDAAHRPLGVVVAISPWNFPLAIFTGQVAAALAAGNPVLAKPAEETPLIAAEAVRLLHAAGVPRDVLHLLPGDGSVGAAVVGDARVNGVMFTGSTAVARLIQGQLAGRLTPFGQPVPLIAETGGLNAMIVDSSALAEQVVGDVIVSAFDSAGQRCSALRILCLQQDIADRTLAMLKGALQEIAVGNPDRLSVDVGPVITAEAQHGIRDHIAAMRARGHAVAEAPLPPGLAHGTFVAPTVIEIERIADVEREVFGPVLHVLRYARQDLDRLVADINRSGYGLTFGLHSRIDETIARVTGGIRAGNIYVNRNIIGAVVGVQPFGGRGLSGTGPKAGGPLYLRRLLAVPPRMALPGTAGDRPATARAYVAWLRAQGRVIEAEQCAGFLAQPLVGAAVVLPGPVGERNVYAWRPRGRIAALAGTESGLLVQFGAILATGNQALIEDGNGARTALAGLPPVIGQQVTLVDTIDNAPGLEAVLFEGEAEALRELTRRLAARDGAIVQAQAVRSDTIVPGDAYDLAHLLQEVSIATNTAAAGGNASLMAMA